jgi:hypothetical protein
MKALSKSQIIVFGFKSIPFLDPIFFKRRKIPSYVSCRLLDVKMKQTGTAKIIGKNNKTCQFSIISNTAFNNNGRRFLFLFMTVSRRLFYHTH